MPWSNPCPAHPFPKVNPFWRCRPTRRFPTDRDPPSAIARLPIDGCRSTTDDQLTGDRRRDAERGERAKARHAEASPALEAAAHRGRPDGLTFRKRQDMPSDHE
jgi:hypothetical protein